MAKYRVSFKMLRKQGEELKAVAKLMDGYTERVNQIRGKLGGDDMLAEIRNNLQKLSSQMGESRVILNMAGEVLTKSVENYTSVETRQVKKVDSLRAHNRDFYKNPVVVASAGTVGGGAAGVAATAAASHAAAGSTTTVNYTETNVQYTAPVQAAAEPVAASYTPEPVATVAAAPETPIVETATGGGMGAAGVAAGFGALGGIAGAGAVAGGIHLKKEHGNKEKTAKRDAPAAPVNAEDPEAQLAEALERARRLERE